MMNLVSGTSVCSRVTRNPSICAGQLEYLYRSNIPCLEYFPTNVGKQTQNPGHFRKVSLVFNFRNVKNYVLS